MQVARRTRPDPPVLDALFAAMKASLEIQSEMLQVPHGMWDGPFADLVCSHSLQWLWSVHGASQLWECFIQRLFKASAAR